jgi:hypothetical protein
VGRIDKRETEGYSDDRKPRVGAGTSSGPYPIHFN